MCLFLLLSVRVTLNNFPLCNGRDLSSTIGVMGSLKWNWTSFYYLYCCSFRFCIVLCLKYNFGFLHGNKDCEPHCIHRLSYEEILKYNVQNIINHQFLTESITLGCCNNLLQSGQSYQLISLSQQTILIPSPANVIPRQGKGCMEMMDTTKTINYLIFKIFLM